MKRLVQENLKFYRLFELLHFSFASRSKTGDRENKDQIRPQLNGRQLFKHEFPSRLFRMKLCELRCGNTNEMNM